MTPREVPDQRGAAAAAPAAPPSDRVADIATLLVQLAPRAVQAMRAHLRTQPFDGVTMSQLRALAFVRRNPDASLSELADHLLVSSPTASVLVSRLVRRKLLRSDVTSQDRRRLALTLSPRGEAIVDRAVALSRDAMRERLRELPPEQHAAVAAALTLLIGYF